MEFKYCGKEILLFVSLSKVNAIKHLHDIHKKKIFVNFKSYMPWLYNETKSLKRGLRALCIESVWLKQVTYPLWIFVSSTRKSSYEYKDVLRFENFIPLLPFVISYTYKTCSEFTLPVYASVPQSNKHPYPRNGSIGVYSPGKAVFVPGSHQEGHSL